MLIDGLHHAREVSTMSMCVYSTMNFLFDYAQRDKATINLLKNTAIFIVPALNYDGLHAVSKYNKDTTHNGYLSKNRHVYDEQEKECGFDELMGVDLSRNYDFEFAHDSIGSSGDICSDNYRGPSAFSEPETQAMRKLIEKYPNIRLAVNFHAYGNHMNIPFNYAHGMQGHSHADDDLMYTHPVIYEYLQKLHKHAPSGMSFGNREINTGRPINGEVSDWMFGKHQIFAISPELGNNDISTNTYYIRSKSTLKKMLANNHGWVHYAAMSLLPQLNVTLTSWTQSTTTWRATFDIVNNGIGHLHNQRLSLYYNSELFDVILKIDDTEFSIECLSQMSCRAEVDHIPSLKANKLKVEIH